MNSMNFYKAAAFIMLVLTCQACWGQSGNGFEGDYTAIFEGQNARINGSAEAQTVNAKTSIQIEQSGQDVTVSVGRIGSVLSATRFTGKAGNGSFVAVHTHPSKPDQVKVIWGRLEDGNILGQLVYPRVAAGLVPGVTDLSFQAYPAHDSATSQKSPRTLRPVKKSKPTIRVIEHQVQPKFIPMPLPENADESEAPTGQSVIYGTIRGALGKIVDVQLVDPDENTLQRVQLKSDGKYRFENIAAGRYWIFVNDGKSEAWISLTSGSQPVDADGSSSHRLDFEVK